MALLLMGIFSFLLSLVFLVIAIGQFMEKGFLFNNAYIWASKEEREALDKKPYYRQSGICFLCFSGVFLFMALECMLQTLWLWIAVFGLAAAVLIYAIISTVRMQ